MVEIYDTWNTNFDRNGDASFDGVTECNVDMPLGGTWKLDLSVILDKEKRYKHVQNGAVVCVPTPVGDHQLFRIYDANKTPTGVVAKANPIFYDSGDEVMLFDCGAVNMSGQATLSHMLENTKKYHAETDIRDLKSSYWDKTGFMDAFAGSDDSSFLNVWGGEPIYDNYTVRVMKHVGSYKGLRVALSFNASNIEADIDDSDVATRLYPYSSDGYGLSGTRPYVDSPLIDHYPKIHAKTITFDHIKMASGSSDSDDKETGDIICKNQADLDYALKRACLEQFDNGIDKPKVSYKVDMVNLHDAKEYEDIKDLEDVGLGDTVDIYMKEHDIAIQARVVRIQYDCVNRAATSIELGNFSYDYFSEINNVADTVKKNTTSYGGLKADKVEGVLNGMKTQLKIQKTVAQRQDSRAILFEDIDPDSPLYGAMCLGTQGFQIANKRTADDTDWDWKTFGTAEGFVASRIIAGILQSKNWDADKKTGFSINLDTGIAYLYSMNLSGSFTSSGRDIDIRMSNGQLYFIKDGEIQFRICPSANGKAYMLVGKNNAPNIAIDPDDKEIEMNSVDKFRMNGYTGVTGTAKFNDGSYLTIHNGIITGGHASQSGDF